MKAVLFVNQWVVVLIAALLLPACDLINPEEAIPAYLYVEDFEFHTDLQKEGSKSEKITEVWASIDGAFLGAYDLPATIPVLEQGKGLIRLQAGIKDNGIASSPDIYPFYEIYEIELDLQLGETYELYPVISYQEGIQFGFIETFEGTLNVFQEIRTGGPQDRIYRTDAEVFEGNYSGVLTVTEDQPVIELATLEKYSGLLDNGFSVYLEMDYKSEAPVIFGLIGSDVGSGGLSVELYHAGFKPKDSWNKIYFNFSQLVLEGDFDQYKVTMEAYLPQEGGVFTTSSAKVWLDNVKLVYF